jgi:ABC-type polysaccharide transport system permease subunit
VFETKWHKSTYLIFHIGLVVEVGLRIILSPINNYKMKQLTKSVTYKPIMALLLANFFTLIVMAQDSSVSSTTTTTTTTQEHTWYTQPWVWIVGGAVLILLIVAIVRGGGSSGGASTDKVTYTKTTETDRT